MRLRIELSHLKDAQLVRTRFLKLLQCCAGPRIYMKTEKEKKFSEIDCVTHEFNKLMKVEMLTGRFLIESDWKQQNVIVLMK